MLVGCVHTKPEIQAWSLRWRREWNWVKVSKKTLLLKDKLALP